MKNIKNDLQIISLLISAFALVVTMILATSDDTIAVLNAELPFELALTLFCFLLAISMVSLVYSRRKKIYVFISYSKKNMDVVCRISTLLDSCLQNDNRFEFDYITEESIPFGENIADATQKNIDRSKYAMIVLTPEYLADADCVSEMQLLITQTKEYKRKVVPIFVGVPNDSVNVPEELKQVKSIVVRGLDDDLFDWNIEKFAHEMRYY